MGESCRRSYEGVVLHLHDRSPPKYLYLDDFNFGQLRVTQGVIVVDVRNMPS